MPLLTNNQNHGRTTRKLNISIKYMELMSKNRREEVEREVLQETYEQVSVMETEILLYLCLFQSNCHSLF